MYNLGHLLMTNCCFGFCNLLMQTPKDCFGAFESGNCWWLGEWVGRVTSGGWQQQASCTVHSCIEHPCGHFREFAEHCRCWEGLLSFLSGFWIVLPCYFRILLILDDMPASVLGNGATQGTGTWRWSSKEDGEWWKQIYNTLLWHGLVNNNRPC